MALSPTERQWIERIGSVNDYLPDSPWGCIHARRIIWSLLSGRVDYIGFLMEAELHPAELGFQLWAIMWDAVMAIPGAGERDLNGAEIKQALFSVGCLGEKPYQIAPHFVAEMRADSARGGKEGRWNTTMLAAHVAGVRWYVKDTEEITLRYTRGLTPSEFLFHVLLEGWLRYDAIVYDFEEMGLSEEAAHTILAMMHQDGTLQVREDGGITYFKYRERI